MESHLTAIVLAAGKGTRMRSDRPKVMYDLCGRPMLSYVLEALREIKPDRIVVVVGHGREQVEGLLADYDGVETVVQEEQNGTGHAVQVAVAKWTDSSRVLVVCGDTPLLQGMTLKSLMQAHHESGNPGVSLLSAQLDNPTGYGRILRDADGNVTAIREEADANEEEKAVSEINAAMYVFDTASLKPALKNLKPDNKQKEIYLTDAVSEIGKAGGMVTAHVCNDPLEILGANSVRELALARYLMQERILQGHMEQGVEILDPNTTFIDADVTIGSGTKVLPCTVIQSGVKIGEHCEVGPFTHLRVGAVMEDRSEVGNFTEMKKSRLGKGSKAKHLAYIGDTQIGDKVNIGAGTITANYDGTSKHETVIKDGAFIGSGTVIVAPAVVGKKAITGAGAIVTKGSKVEAGSVVVGIPAKPLRKKVKEG